jgi:hypothetical protein
MVDMVSTFYFGLTIMVPLFGSRVIGLRPLPIKLFSMSQHLRESRGDF